MECDTALKLRAGEPRHPSDALPLSPLDAVELGDLAHAAHEAGRLRFGGSLLSLADEAIDGSQGERYKDLRRVRVKPREPGRPFAKSGLHRIICQLHQEN